MSETYSEKLSARMRALDSRLCVGLDPRPDLIEGDLADFLIDVVRETAEFAAAFKPNAAYFEALGSRGLQAMERVLESIPPEVPVVLDVKRSDIPETMKYYAQACYGMWRADAVTLNPMLGFDSIEPFLVTPGKGVYLLAVTSNPGAADLELREMEGRYLFEHIQDFATRAAGYPADVGLVVGLTQAGDTRLSRVADLPLLVPGLGAQGGDPAALNIGGRQAPVLINSSRSILYGSQGSFGSRAAATLQDLREKLPLR